MKKNNVWMLMWALLLGGTALVSCSDDDNYEMLEQDRARVATFMQNAAASDMFEITTGTMAQEQGETADVQMFGDMLVEDHSMTAMKIKEMADERNVNLPQSLPAPKQEIATRLDGKTGMDFDKDFAAIQVEAHQEAIALYEEADRDIADTEVQAFIDATLPTLRMHFTHAQQLKTTIDGM